MLYLNITQMENQFEASLLGADKENWEKQIDRETEKIICHEPVLIHEDNPGERLIEALACCTGDGDNESPGIALEHLLRSAFMLGLANGAQMERDRIIGNLTDLCDV